MSHIEMQPTVSKTPLEQEYSSETNATLDKVTKILERLGHIQEHSSNVNSRPKVSAAPLGLSAFALTTFLLSLINLRTLNIQSPSIVIGVCFGYGGLVQLVAGIWEIVSGEIFGGTAFSSYGGFWIALGIILTPGGFEIAATLNAAGKNDFNASFGLFLIAWFVFTSLLSICCLRTNVAFIVLFGSLALAFLMLGIAYIHDASNIPNEAFARAGGSFGLIAAFTAWYCAVASLCEQTGTGFHLWVGDLAVRSCGNQKRAIQKEAS